MSEQGRSRRDWALWSLAALAAVFFFALIPLFAPSLTDPLTGPVLRLLSGPAGEQVGRPYSTSGLHDPIVTVQEMVDPEGQAIADREAFGILRLFDRGGRQIEVSPNYQLVSSFDKNTAIAGMARGIGRLRLQYEGSNQIDSFCTGALISEKLILTASHCFFKDPDHFRPWAKVNAITFDLGDVDPKTPPTITLDVKAKPVEIVCPAKDHCRPASDDFDFAILEIKPDGEQTGKDKGWTMAAARAKGFAPVRLASLETEEEPKIRVPGHQFVLVHYPKGVAKVVTERNCRMAIKNVKVRADDILIPHLCDTEWGSSGGAVFSRDHEVMIALHVSGAKYFSDSERETDASANHALLISAIAKVSKHIGTTVTVEDRPPTAHQRFLIDYTNARGEEAKRLMKDERNTLASYVALDGLERLLDRPDGDYLLSQAPGIQGKLADALSMQSERTVFRGHTGKVTSAAFSPDRKLVVTASLEPHSGARMWDAATGKEVRALIGHKGGITSVNFSVDGKFIVTASEDDTARLWNAATGKEIRVLRGHEGGVIYATFSPSGKSVLTTSGDPFSSSDNTARIWDMVTGAEIQTFEGHEDWVNNAAFSTDGKFVVTASRDKTARIWDAVTGKEIRNLKHGEVVASAAFSTNGKLVVTASWDGAAHIWDAATGREIRSLNGHKRLVTSATFDRTGNFVLTASYDKTARIWDVTTGETLRIFNGHEDVVTSANFSSDGKAVVTASEDKTARLWDAVAGNEIRTLPHENWATSAAFSGDGRFVVSAASDTAQLWDAVAGAKLRTFKGHQDRVTTASFSPDDKLVVTASQDETARIWDTATATQVQMLRGHTDWVNSAAFRSDGKLVVTASRDRSVRIWDAVTGKQISALEGPYLGVSRAVFNHDGTLVLSSSEDGTARIWNAATGRVVRDFRANESGLTSAAFNPNSKLVVTASYDNAARLWDANTGSEVHAFKGHEGWVTSAAFSADGKYVVTASWDDTARIWSAVTGKEIRVLKGHKDVVTSAAFSPNGKYVVTASGDPSVRIWPVGPQGPDLVEAAYCRLRSVAPSREECRLYELDCSRLRNPRHTCKIE